MYHKQLTSLYIITLCSFIVSGFHTDFDNEHIHEHKHIHALSVTYSHPHPHEEEDKKSHNYDTCHICYFMYSMDNDAELLSINLNNSSFTKIDIYYNFNTIYDGLLKSRAPPC